MANVSKFSFCLAGIGNYAQLLPPLERVLKKSFSPSMFDIHLLQYDETALRRIAERIAELKRIDKFPFDLGEFSSLESRALVPFVRQPFNCSVVVESNHTPAWSKGKGVRSHYGIRALLVENLRSSDWDMDNLRLVPYMAKLEMPYLGDMGSTAEQVDRATRTVLKSLIEGWKHSSRRTDGSILHRLEAA